jgi:hypothetical protein
VAQYYIQKHIRWDAAKLEKNKKEVRKKGTSSLILEIPQIQKDKKRGACKNQENKKL